MEKIIHLRIIQFAEYGRNYLDLEGRKCSFLKGRGRFLSNFNLKGKKAQSSQFHPYFQVYLAALWIQIESGRQI